MPSKEADKIRLAPSHAGEANKLPKEMVLRHSSSPLATEREYKVRSCEPNTTLEPVQTGLDLIASPVEYCQHRCPFEASRQ